MGLLNIIRRMHLRQKLSIREIARLTGVSRNTVTKHLAANTIEPKFATLIALRHPERVRRVVTYGALYGPPQEAIRPEMFGPPIEQKPDGDGHSFAHHHYMRVAPEPNHWPVFWKKLMDLIPVSLTKDELSSIKPRILVSVGDNDFISLEHAIYAYRNLRHAELAVIPDATHFLLYDRPQRLEPIVAEFLSAPEQRLPFGTIATGYQPGKTR